MRKRFLPYSAALLLLIGCGGDGPEAPDPAVSIDPNAPSAPPDGPPPGVGVRGTPGSVEAEQGSALLD